MKDSELVNQLQQASSGLLWMSESDYPFETFFWKPSTMTTEQLLQSTGHPPSTPVKVIELERFFRPAVREQSWHTEEERATVKRYQALVNTLHRCLSYIQVYRIGKTEVDIYIIGTTSSGNLAGLSTKAVET